MEGIKAAAEALSPQAVTITVKGLDWADDECVAELGDFVRANYGDGVTRFDSQIDAIVRGYVQGAFIEILGYQPELDFLTVHVTDLSGPGGGWPVVTITGPVVEMDAFLYRYFEVESRSFRATALADTTPAG